MGGGVSDWCDDMSRREYVLQNSRIWEEEGENGGEERSGRGEGVCRGLGV